MQVDTSFETPAQGNLSSVTLSSYSCPRVTAASASAGQLLWPHSFILPSRHVAWRFLASQQHDSNCVPRSLRGDKITTATMPSHNAYLAYKRDTKYLLYWTIHTSNPSSNPSPPPTMARRATSTSPARPPSRGFWPWPN